MGEKDNTLKKGVANKSDPPNSGDEGQGLKAECDYFNDGHALMPNCDDEVDWVRVWFKHLLPPSRFHHFELCTQLFVTSSMRLAFSSS